MLRPNQQSPFRVEGALLMIVNPARLCYTDNEKAPLGAGLGPDQVIEPPARFVACMVAYLRRLVKGRRFCFRAVSVGTKLNNCTCGVFFPHS